MPLNLFYTMVQKSQKWPKTQIKGGGPALISIMNQENCNLRKSIAHANLWFHSTHKLYLGLPWFSGQCSIACSQWSHGFNDVVELFHVRNWFSFSNECQDLAKRESRSLLCVFLMLLAYDRAGRLCSALTCFRMWRGKHVSGFLE